MHLRVLGAERRDCEADTHQTPIGGGRGVLVGAVQGVGSQSPPPTRKANNMDPLIKRMTLVRDDCAPDAKALDGKPLTGHAVGTAIGQVLAMIEAIADTLIELLEEREQHTPEPTDDEDCGCTGGMDIISDPLIPCDKHAQEMYR